MVPWPLRWLPAGAVGALICYWSLVTAPPALQPLEPTATLTTSGVASVPGSYQRHAVAYAALTLALAYAIADRNAPAVRKALLVFSLATGYGALMEFGQFFLPERTASMIDIAINAVGSALALSWYHLEQRVQFVPVGRTLRSP
nr:VanZ family protein [Natronolimnobius sp. AArcel1]